MKISVQLYSLRDEAQDDLLGVITKCAQMGYDGVEFAGYFGHSAEAIKKCLDDNNIVCSGAHVPVTAFDDENLEETIAFHKTIGCPYPMIPWLPEDARNTPEACLKTAEQLTALSAKAVANGMKTGFHCHEGDMRPLSNGESAWNILANNTPKDFILQYDTANGSYGGADPVQPILDHPGRGISIHFKGFPTGTPVGEGDIPWDKLIDACKNHGGTEWIVVEHETYIDMTPEESVKRGLDNLKNMLK